MCTTIPWARGLFFSFNLKPFKPSCSEIMLKKQFTCEIHVYMLVSMCYKFKAHICIDSDTCQVSHFHRHRRQVSGFLNGPDRRGFRALLVVSRIAATSAKNRWLELAKVKIWSLEHATPARLNFSSDFYSGTVLDVLSISTFPPNFSAAPGASRNPSYQFDEERFMKNKLTIRLGRL